MRRTPAERIEKMLRDAEAAEWSGNRALARAKKLREQAAEIRRHAEQVMEVKP